MLILVRAARPRVRRGDPARSSSGNIPVAGADRHEARPNISRSLISSTLADCAAAAAGRSGAGDRAEEPAIRPG
ncbi:MAG: hypothetical protein MZV49_20945 [Rhodopseudomonas palustris]|nr:hypothetical protein [Rhodopseudomonas palustris]